MSHAANKAGAAMVKLSGTSPTRHKSPAPTDHLTVLMTAPGHTASKRFVKTATGVKKLDFNAGLLFGVMKPQLVRDIYGMSDVLVAVETFPNMLVIRGLPASDAFVGDWVRRTGSGDVGNFFTPSAGHHWIVIDFDKIKIPKRLSLKRNPVAVCEHLVGLLPAEFHGATYHWQMSSSAGMGANDVVSMHIWFWLMRPVPDQDLKAWGTAVNHKVGCKLIDTALFQHVQAHYTAAPTFEGMANPFPVRSGLHIKAQDAVNLVPPEVVARPTRGTFGSASSLKRAATGAGFEYHLSRIGDHAGGDGFHGPIAAAAASYANEHGEDGTDTEALYELIKDAVLAADARNHDPAYIEHMASREHIMPAIRIVQQFFPGAVLHKMDLPRNAHVVQCHSTTCSTTSLVPVRNTALTSAARAQQRLLDIERLLARLAIGGAKVLVVGPTAVVGNPRTQQPPLISVPAGCELAHFNALRGIDRWKDLDVVVVIGRNQPATTAVENMARAIFLMDPTPLRLGGQWTRQKRGYRLRKGLLGVDVTVHPDARVQAVLEQLREGESQQAIDRLRPVRSLQQKTVVLLSNLPLDIDVHETRSWDELIHGTRLERAWATCNGTLPLNPGWLAAKFTGLWPTAAAAKKDIGRASKKGQLSNPTAECVLQPSTTRARKCEPIELKQERRDQRDDASMVRGLASVARVSIIFSTLTSIEGSIFD